MGWFRETVSLLQWFKSLTWSTSSWFPLANHLALPGSESLCYKFRVLSCLCKSLSQDRFRHRGLWGRLTPPIMQWYAIFSAPEEPFCTCAVGKFSFTSRMRNMQSLYLSLFFPFELFLLCQQMYK